MHCFKWLFYRRLKDNVLQKAALFIFHCAFHFELQSMAPLMSRFGLFHHYHSSCASQYPLYTIMVYNKFQHGVPVVWVLTERWEVVDMALVLKAVKKAAERERASMGLEPWRPNCWIVDCASEEQKAITWGHFILQVFFVYHACHHFYTPHMKFARLIEKFIQMSLSHCHLACLAHVDKEYCQ